MSDIETGNGLGGWGILHPDADTIAEQGMTALLMVLVSILNFYSFTKLLNVFRAIWSTNFFTNKPLQGGYIAEGEEPIVTIQICCYNEEAVIEATINAACSVDWPKDKLFVQVLDDSTDNTVNIVEDLAASWREKGVNCVRLTRPSRRGYKAGNLHDMEDQVQGNFAALFDADHRCEPNFLRRTVPHFFHKDGSDNPEIGLVQVPWAYYNTHANLLTEYDALNLDYSHVIEQQGRAAALQCFGFNGTGGIWRRSAIAAGGGWNWDTVTEDLDLSYASHLQGYKFKYLRDIPQQLELPTGILAHKQQKHRWTKGYWQVLRKSLWKILTRKESSFWIKLEAISHMSCAVSNPVTLMVMILVTVLTYQRAFSLFMVVYCMVPFTCVMVALVCTIYGKVTGSNGHYQSFGSRTCRLALLPIMVVFSMGMSVYETYAMYEGMVSNDATFLRTPKEGSKETSPTTTGGATDDAEEQVIANVLKNDKKKRKGGFATEMFLVIVGLLLASYFTTFAVYSVVTKDMNLKSLYFGGFLLPAVGLGLFHSFMLRALLARRAEQQAKKNKDLQKTKTKEDSSQEGEEGQDLSDTAYLDRSESSDTDRKDSDHDCEVPTNDNRPEERGRSSSSSSSIDDEGESSCLSVEDEDEESLLVGSWQQHVSKTSSARGSVDDDECCIVFAQV